MGKRLSTTLAWAFVTVAILPAALVVATLYFFQREGYEGQAATRLDGVLDAVEVAWRSEAERALRSLQTVARDGEVARSAWRLSRGDWDAAARLRRRLEELTAEEGLGFLALSGPGGNLLAAASRPAPVPAGQLARPPVFSRDELGRLAEAPGVPPLAAGEGGDLHFLSPGGDREGLILLVRRPLTVPGEEVSERLVLAGGLLLGRETLASLAGAAGIDVHLIWMNEGTGEVLASVSGTGGQAAEGFLWERELVRRAAIEAQEIELPAGRYRLRASLLSGSGSDWPAAVVAGVPVSRGGGELGRLLLVGLAALTIGIIMAGALAVHLSRRVSEPVGELARAAELVAAGVLERQVPVRRSDELGELVASFNRMTERLVRYREAERRQERVLAWNEVARRLAHQLKNPLTPIRLIVEDFRRSCLPGKEGSESILDEGTKTILSEVRSLEHIVEEFSRFSRLPKPSFAPRDLNSLVVEVCSLYLEGREGVELRQELAKDLPPVELDDSLFRQAMANIVTNALEALEDKGGTLTLSTRRAGETVLLMVVDTGRGMTAEELRRAGEPYFTRRRGGTGLGLAVAERILLEHGGRLEIRSRVGEGTTVTLVLPISQKRKGDAQEVRAGS